MASANVTLSDNGSEFESDTTQRTATLLTPGGFIRNTSASEIVYINVEAATCATSQPVGAGGRTVKAGQVCQLPVTCRAFTFKSSASANIQYSKTSPGA